MQMLSNYSYSKQEFDSIKARFPGLEYQQKNNLIIGYIYIGPCRYVKEQDGRFTVKSCTVKDNGCITGEYLIRINLGSATKEPEVYEISEKIESVAKNLKKSLADLHLFPHNRQCCLGIRIEPTKSLSEFILHDVYPYFVWQAYYSQYQKIPPCGEYSHGNEGIKEAAEDYKKTICCLDKYGRNQSCPCGSGKKYKCCCRIVDEEKKRHLENFTNLITKKLRPNPKKQV